MASQLVRWIPHKRAFLARALGLSGLVGLLEWVIRRRRPMLAVLTYHRIAVPGVRSDPYYDPVISATPEGFDHQLRFLRRYFRPIELEELRDSNGLQATLSRTKQPLALVTFDDGYRDNFEVALPILRRHGVPATFFIPSSFLSRPRLPWWDRVAYVLKHTEAERLTLGRYEGDPAPLPLVLGRAPDDHARFAAIGRTIRLFLDGEIPDEGWFLEQLGAQAGVPVDADAAGRALFMTVEQIRGLAGSGVSVGSHGHSHTALARLDEADERRELEESRQTLEETLGREVFAVAYPFGWAGTFTARTQRLAAEAGYRFGFSSLEGVNHPGSASFEPYCLRRLNVGTGDSGSLLRARAALHGSAGRSFL